MTDRGEGLAVAVVAAATLLAGGLALIPPFGLMRDPQSATKVFALIAIALTALAAPFAFAEGWSDRRFRRARHEIEARGGWTRIAPYAGGLGRGVEFVSETQRLVLIEPLGGIGAPRLVEEVVVAPEPLGDAPDRPADAPPLA